jgi:hypothetical protein
VILGFSGDADSDVYYTKAMDLFPNSALLYYKHLSGEFNTASGFSTFMACHILKTTDSNVMMINPEKKSGEKCTALQSSGDVQSILTWYCWKELNELKDKRPQIIK